MTDVLEGKLGKLGETTTSVVPPKLTDPGNSSISSAIDKLRGDNLIKEDQSPKLQVEKLEDKYYHLGKEVRLGSRVVAIFQRPKFSLLPKGSEAKTIRAEQIKKIGSQWKRGTRDIIRGLSEEEENFYLPKMLGIPANSEKFNEKVLEHWVNFSIEVPPVEAIEDGIEIEAGFELIPGSGNKAKPISLDGYMKYNFCLANGEVATLPEELDNPALFAFVLVDKAKAQVDKEARFQSMKSVNRLFSQLINSDAPSDKDKIQWILETEAGEDGVGISVVKMTSTQREIELEKFKNDKPERFIDLIKDPNLEVKAMIRKAIEVGALTQEGNSIFLDNKTIGQNLKDAVGYLNNPANQQDRMTVTARIKAYRE